MPNRKLLLDSLAIEELLSQMAQQIVKFDNDFNDVVLVGIQQGGVVLADRLAQMLNQQWNRVVPIGQLDINMHRDDLDNRVAPRLHPTSIPFDIADKTVVLVDDVLFSGRTVRAALDALTDFGRPRRIQLAVLIDRGHRELPIRADFVGTTITTNLTDRVDVQLHEQIHEAAVYLEPA